MDRELVERARLGDVGAFEALVRQRMDAVYRLTLAILGDEADARDATQETFVAAWRQLPRLRESGRFEAWLQRIAVNASRMTLRSRDRRRVREIPSETVVRLATGGGGAPVSDGVLLDAAMRRLPVEQRAILVLHHLAGRPPAEVAEILGVPVGTAKSRLFHARRALGRALSEERS